MMTDKETASPQATPSGQPWLRRKIGLAEAAEILGLKPAAVYKRAKDGDIAYIQYGPHGRMLFFEDEVEKYAHEGYHPPLKENPPSAGSN